RSQTPFGNAGLRNSVSGCSKGAKRSFANRPFPNRSLGTRRESGFAPPIPPLPPFAPPGIPPRRVGPPVRPGGGPGRRKAMTIRTVGRGRVLAAVGLVGAAAVGFWLGRGGPQSAAVAAPPIPPAAPPPSDYTQRVVAYIYGTVPITREDLGEYLIARKA